MKLYDLDAMVAAMEPPAILLGGKQYRGKLVGFLDSQRLLQRFQQLDAARKRQELDPAEYVAFLRDLCDTLGLPSDLILKQPAPVVTAVMRDFFTFLAQTSLKPPMNGSSSPSAESVGPPDSALVAAAAFPQD